LTTQLNKEKNSHTLTQDKLAGAKETAADDKKELKKR
jgi:hypothetical protein